MSGIIHRREVAIGQPFTGPLQITFGFQECRRAFSVWFLSNDPLVYRYVVLGTGDQFTGEIVATCVLPDGFHVYHLCRIGMDPDTLRLGTHVDPEQL